MEAPSLGGKVRKWQKAGGLIPFCIPGVERGAWYGLCSANVGSAVGGQEEAAPHREEAHREACFWKSRTSSVGG